MTVFAPLFLALLPLEPGSVQEGPALLPPTPAGWSYERLEFPLQFAPDIELEGYEDLRFAPGMFAPGSDTFFSYVLGIRAAGELTVDIAFLEDFLWKYYHGLCESVAKDRFEVDLSKIAVEVKATEAGFEATVEMYDAFVSGDALTLRLELLVHALPNATEIFGLASPLAKSEPVWDELHALGEAWRRARAGSVFLNHVYIVVDQATYDAVAASDFMQRALGVFEERETVRADMSYAGLYFYGEHSYFELLRPDTANGFAVGGTGVALGVDRAGGVKDVAARLEAAGIQSFAGEITRALKGEQVPWFDILGVEKPTVTSKLSLFAMEYDSAFLASWHPELPPAGGGVSRAAVLERYAARLQRHETRRGTLFQEVTEVHLALDADERERLFAVCRALDYAVEEGEGRWTCAGPNHTLVVSPSEEPGGVTGFRLSLRRPLENNTMTFGNATLTFEGHAATFAYRKL
jgi:hypothetical protein